MSGATARVCRVCGKSLAGRRSRARYCDAKCKAKWVAVQQREARHADRYRRCRICKAKLTGTAIQKYCSQRCKDRAKANRKKDRSLHTCKRPDCEKRFRVKRRGQEYCCERCYILDKAHAVEVLSQEEIEARALEVRSTWTLDEYQQRATSDKQPTIEDYIRDRAQKYLLEGNFSTAARWLRRLR